MPVEFPREILSVYTQAVKDLEASEATTLKATKTLEKLAETIKHSSGQAYKRSAQREYEKVKMALNNIRGAKSNLIMEFNE